jgi:predicted metal-dependent HD superfamily phosphohydrolase
MATRHEAVPQTKDEKVLIDVDLWILGAPQARFDEYEKQVREEYRWVPGLIYRHKRREILASFAARPTIYNTERFIERYEQQARANLARSLARR